MRTCLLVTLCVLGLTGTTSVLAHPGHGNPETQTGLVHYVVSPIHLLPVLAATIVACIGAAVAVRYTRMKRRKMGAMSDSGVRKTTQENVKAAQSPGG